MASSDGIISANYLKTLLDMQENLIIKPVRFLTRKHLYPSNLEKMKVYPDFTGCYCIASISCSPSRA
jgi:hypothetical protein